jgi:Pentapeptide repeats (9 copies)
MILHAPRQRPESWRDRCAALQHRWMVSLLALEYPFEWLAYLLSRWSLLEVLDYLGSFSILIAVIFYFSESGDRLKQKHYQAWQVINTAQGKGGSGGRIDALQELNMDGVPLVGVDVSGAFLQGLQLPRARLLRANFNAVDARNSGFKDADFVWADLRSANFRKSNLTGSNLQDADLSEGDFCGANLTSVNFAGATLDDADLGNTDLADIKWQSIQSVKGTSLQQVRNAPKGFLDWAAQHGAMTSGGHSDCQ